MAYKGNSQLKEFLNEFKYARLIRTTAFCILGYRQEVGLSHRGTCLKSSCEAGALAAPLSVWREGV